MDKIKIISQSLGLIPTEVLIIETLVKGGAASVQTLAQKNGIGPHGHLQYTKEIAESLSSCRNSK